MTTALAEEWDWSLGDKPSWLADGEALLESCERTSTMPSPPPSMRVDMPPAPCDAVERRWAGYESAIETTRITALGAEAAAALLGRAG